MPVSEYTPTVQSVAAILRARTKTKGGAEAGTFNPEAVEDNLRTRPTAEGVLEQIATALGDISGVVGEDILEKFRPAASRVATLRTALLIELSYFPEQINSDRSPYPQLLALYNDAWVNLKSAMGIDTDEDGGSTPEEAGYPSYGGFPNSGIGMEQPW